MAFKEFERKLRCRACSQRHEGLSRHRPLSAGASDTKL